MIELFIRGLIMLGVLAILGMAMGVGLGFLIGLLS